MARHAVKLSGAAIEAHCHDAVDIVVVDSTGSTNADLLLRVPDLPGPTLLIAEHQTAGRGRAGRSWLSQADASLTFSLAWNFQGPLQRLAGLPLAVGVSLAETLIAVGVPVQLKWPNDVLIDGSKLAGILIETRSGLEHTIWAVIGIGLNLALPDSLEAAIGRPAAAAPALARFDRNRLVAALLNGLGPALAQFDGAGFGPFRPRWNQLDAYRGQAVAIVDHGRLLHEGRAAGVDQFGRLLLDGASGREKIVSGDVSLRLQTR